MACCINCWIYIVLLNWKCQLLFRLGPTEVYVPFNYGEENYFFFLLRTYEAFLWPLFESDEGICTKPALINVSKSYRSIFSLRSVHVSLLCSGRIHAAVVSGINVETKSVTVEWFERGETKGKEIELDQILDLNQDLAPQSYENSNVIPNKLQKVMLNTGCPGSHWPNL